MTHAELFQAHPAPGLPASDCPGELALLWSRAEPMFDPASRGWSPHTIELHECAACGKLIVVDATVRPIANVYEGAKPRPPAEARPNDLVEDLARAFRLPGEEHP